MEHRNEFNAITVDLYITNSSAMLAFDQNQSKNACVYGTTPI